MTFESIIASLDKIERDLARARRLMRVQAFIIGFLACALILSYLR